MRDGKYINKEGKEVSWASEAFYQFFSKNLHDITMKDIKKEWEITLQNLGWIK